MQLKDAAQLALKKMPSAEQEAISHVRTIIYLFNFFKYSFFCLSNSFFLFMLIINLQSEYQRGVSAWNFDLEELKFRASLVFILS